MSNLDLSKANLDEQFKKGKEEKLLKKEEAFNTAIKLWEKEGYKTMGTVLIACLAVNPTDKGGFQKTDKQIQDELRNFSGDLTIIDVDEKMLEKHDMPFKKGDLIRPSQAQLMHMMDDELRRKQIINAGLFMVDFFSIELWRDGSRAK